MNLVLWTLQIILAAVFVSAGMLKLLRSRKKLAPKLPWVDQFSDLAVKFIGFAEVTGGFGLVLPLTLKILPALTVWSAICLALLMGGAVMTHLQLKDARHSIPAIALAALCLVVAWGRLPYFS